MPEIRALGAELIAVTPQTLEKSVELVGQRKLGFDLLRDEENRFAEQLGLRFKLPDDLIALYKNFGLDLEASNGEAGWTLAMPARYVVDKTGTVRYAAVHPDYTKRPEPEETLEALRGL